MLWKTNSVVLDTPEAEAAAGLVVDHGTSPAAVANIDSNIDAIEDVLKKDTMLNKTSSLDLPINYHLWTTS